MTLPVNEAAHAAGAAHPVGARAPAAPPCPDPYGLWESVYSAGGAGQVSFGEPGNPAPEGMGFVAVWRLALSTREPDAGHSELDRRARRLEEIELRLADADRRVESIRRAGASAGPISFGVEGEATEAHLPEENLLPPEVDLERALVLLESQAGGTPAGAVDFGVREMLAQAAGIDLNGMQDRFSALMDGINRQILHAAWVETTLDGRLVARTVINWGGDLTTLMITGLAADTLHAHQASLAQAVASEAANLKTVLIVAQVAAKIALAATTPLGPAQLLALAYQFVREVVSGK